jgi:hypothetical protein
MSLAVAFYRFSKLATHFITGNRRAIPPGGVALIIDIAITTI